MLKKDSCSISNNFKDIITLISKIHYLVNNYPGISRFLVNNDTLRSPHHIESYQFYHSHHRTHRKLSLKSLNNVQLVLADQNTNHSVFLLFLHFVQLSVGEGSTRVLKQRLQIQEHIWFSLSILSSHPDNPDRLHKLQQKMALNTFKRQKCDLQYR